MIRKIEVQGVRTNSRPFSLTKQPTHTGRNTPTPGEPKASPGSSQPRDKSCLGIQQICVGKVHPPACKAAVWGFHFISQAFKMPKGKAFRRTLRVTSLFFGSVKRNREKRSWIVLIPSFKYHVEGDGMREEDVWNCRSPTR